MAGLIAADHLADDLVVTSICDGEHSRTSLHWSGCAADLRRWNIPDPNSFVDWLREALTDEFDVVLEDDHIHMEFQPKR